MNNIVILFDIYINDIIIISNYDKVKYKIKT